MEDHFGVAPEQCNIVSGDGIDDQTLEWRVEVESGEGDGFIQMLDWLEDADLSDSTNYAHVSELVDIDNFIDYQILETFIANTDWPANNLRSWQTGDSKWRFAFFDGDATMIDKDYDALGNATYVGPDRWYTGDKSTLLFRRLLENNDFKVRFKERVNVLCNSVLLFDNLNPILSGLEQALQAEIPSQIDRFGYPESYEYWQWGCYLTRDFLRERVSAYQAACDDFELLKPHQYQSNTNDFVIYPNPTDNEVHIRMLDGRSRTTGFVLCDVTGRVILGGKSYLPAYQEIVLGSELRSGVYLVRIGSKVHRFVKY